MPAKILIADRPEIDCRGVQPALDVDIDRLAIGRKAAE